MEWYDETEIKLFAHNDKKFVCSQEEPFKMKTATVTVNYCMLVVVSFCGFGAQSRWNNEKWVYLHLYE